MSFALFIDDLRNPIDVKWGSYEDQLLYQEGDWIIARDWPEVCELILTFGIPYLISFDHDLGENKASGFDIAKSLVNLALDGGPKYAFPEDFSFMIHSKNPVGVQNIQFYLDGYLAHLQKTAQLDSRFRVAEGYTF